MLLILAFTISVSFASEDIESIQANEDIGQEPIGINDESMDDLKESDSTDEKVLNSVDETEKLSVEGEYGNFTELQELINGKSSGSTIYLNKSYVYDEGFVKTGVFIDEELTIDGQGHSIDGNFSARILNVTASKITLKNIIFCNSRLNYANGGAIHFSNNMSDCEFDNVSFFNNNLNIANGNNHVVMGGAVYFAGSLSDSRFDNCRFENNSLTSGGDLNKFMGAAIAVEGVADNLEFNNCNFENNYLKASITKYDRVDGYGGAIYFGSNTTNISYFRTDFRNNNITLGPGHSSYYYSFTQNAYGGAVCYNGRSTLNNFTDCVFYLNRAFYGGYYYSAEANGGAVYFRDSDYNTFLNCVFEENYAKDGTVFFGNDKTYFNSFISTNFTDNDAVEYCAAIFGYLYNSTISDCDFIHNYAYYWGAVRSVNEGTVVINSRFNKNTVAYRYDGGAIGVVDNATLINCSFDHNQGAISDAINCVLDGCNFTNNYLTGEQSDRRGPAISNMKGNVYIYNSLFEDNKGSIGGAIYTLYETNLTLINSTFKNNTADHTSGGGGAIYFSSNYNGYMSCVGINCTFEDNRGISGGAINCYGTVDLKFENTSFINNTAWYSPSSPNEGNGGGAIQLGFNSRGSELELNNVSFIGNTAFNDGGAVSFYSSSGNVIMNGVKFINNSATNTAGAFYGSGYGTIEITNATFSNNSAGKNGGALSSGGYTDLTIKNSTFDNNFANGSGGVLYAVKLSNVLVEDTSFSNNSAMGDGGVICQIAQYSGYSNSNVNFIRVNFTDNSATDYGGAMYLLSSTITDINFIDSIFTNNSAEYGGAVAFDNIAAYGSYINDNHFINSTFESNSALDGGAIYIVGQASENGIIGVVFVNNTASDYGGAVYLIGEKNVIDNSQFDENQADFGGAIYLDKNDNSITNSNFTSNSAISGGAIYAEYSANRTQIENCSFKNNTVLNENHIYNPDEGYGGSLHFSNGNHDIIGSTFEDNEAHFGSAISFWGDARAKIVNTEFNGNKLDNISIWIVIMDEPTLDIGVGLLAGNTQLNAIYSENENLEFVNVTYYGDMGKTNTDEGIPQFTPVISNQNVTLEFYDEKGVCVSNSTNMTRDDGLAIFDDFGLEYDHYYLKAYHLENRYYAYGETYDEIGIMGDFQRLQMLINRLKENETMVLTRNYTFTDGLDDPYNTIKINKSITIDGAGFTIDAFNRASIFEIITEEIIDPATGNTIGFISPKVTFENINFVNSSADIGPGSMIKGIGVENVTIRDCNFTQSIQYQSDAIYFAVSRNVTIVNCNFDNCYSQDGDAIYLNGAYDVTIEQCSFVNCTNIAVAISAGDNVSVNNCNFTECYGTVYFFDMGNVSVYECNLTDCGDMNFEDVYNASIFDCNFNRTNSIRINSYGPMTNASISECNFEEGGGISVLGDSVMINVNMSYCNFTYTYQSIYATGIANSTIEYCNFFYNSETALHLEGDNNTISHCNFTNNSIYYSWGREPQAYAAAAYISGNGNEIYDCVFDGNDIYCHGYYTYGEGYGGAMLITGDKNILHDLAFINNYVDAGPAYGGALFIGGASNLTVSNVDFVNNSITGYGGAIALSSYYMPWPVSQTVYPINNTINECKFINNTADNGGAISIFEYSEGITLINASEFVGNSARQNGGAIYVQSDSTVFTDYMWCNRTATFADSDITKLNRQHTVISNSKFENNTDYELKIVANDMVHDENHTIEIVLPSDATGFVYVNVTDEYGNLINDRQGNPINGTYELVGGRVAINTTELGYGRYYVNAVYSNDTYDWNRYYYYHINSTMFRATDAISLNITANQTIYIGENLTVIVNIDKNLPNTVNITIFNQNNRFTFHDLVATDGRLNYTVSNLPAGDYEVVVTYNGDNTYGCLSNGTVTTVLKKPAYVNITVNNTYYPDDAVVVIQVPSYQQGMVSVYYGFWERQIFITDGYAQFNISGLSIGSHFIWVDFWGSDIYDNAYSDTSFKVLMRLDVSVDNVTVDDDVVFNITAASDRYINSLTIVDADGNVLYDGVFGEFINVGKLPEGHKSVNVTVTDSNYRSVSRIVNFTVSKAYSELTVGNITFTYGESGSTSVDYVGATNVTANVVGHSEAVVVVGDKLITVSNLGTGNYTLNVTTLPDSDHAEVTKLVSVTVLRAKSLVEIENIVNVTYPASTIINFTVTNVTVVNWTIVNKDTGDVINGSGLNNITRALAAGNYTITIENVETVNITGFIAVSDFSVYKVDSNVVIAEIGNVTYPDSVVINFTASNASDVNWTIVNKDTGDVISGSGLNNISEALAAGNYTVTIESKGTDNVTGFVTSKDFTVNKAASSVVINPIANVTYPASTIINFTVTNVTVVNWTIVNKDTGDVINGSGLNNITKALDAGDYTITIVNEGTVNITGSQDSVDFTVYQAKSFVNAGDVVEVYGINATITINSINATTVNVTILDKDNKVVYSNAAIANGNVVLPILAIGEYKVNLTTNVLDGNYSVAVNQSTLTVVKANSSVVIDPVVNVTYDGVTVINFTVTNVTNVTWTIKNKQTGAEINGGGLENITKALDAGNYTIIIINEDNVNITGSQASVDFTVYQAKSFVNASDVTVVYGINAVISVNSINTSAVNVTVIDKDNNIVYNCTVLANVEVVLPILAIGEYKVNLTTIVFDGNYTAAVNQSTLTVIKVNSSVVINPIVNVTYNASTVINFTVANVTNVTWTIKNKATNVEINGSGLENITKALMAGNYTITIVNEDNANITGSQASADFTVYKAFSSVNINVNNVTYNATVSVEFSVENATTVIYTLKYANGTVISENVTINDLSKNLTLDLGAGDYKITILNVESENITASEASVLFSVYKVNSTVTVNVNNVTYNATVSVEFSVENATAVTYTLKYANGTVIKENVTITDLSKPLTFNLGAGDYDITIFNSDSENITGSDAGALFSVYKANSTVTVNVENVTYPNNVTVNVAVENQTTVIYNVTKGTEVIIENAVWDGNNITLFNLAAGNYTITVVNKETENFSGDIKSANFTVNKAPSTLNVSNITYTYGQSGNTAVSYDGATGVMLGIIGGGNIEFKDNVITVSNFSAGNYSLDVTTIPDENHTAVTVWVNITVNPAASSVSAQNVNVTYGEVIVVHVTSENATNVTYEVKDASGKVVAEGAVGPNEDIAGLKLDVGNYTLTLTTGVDKNHTSATSTTNIAVNKISEYNITVNSTSPNLGENATVSVNVPENATGNVTVTLSNGTNYTAEIKDGNATVNIPDLPAGDNNATVTYSGDDKYSGKSTTTTIHVKNMFIEADNMKRGWDSPYDYLAKVTFDDGTPAVNKTVIFEINATQYTATTDEDGIAKLTAKLDVGKYNVTSILVSTGANVTKELEIVARIIENNDLVMDYNDGHKFSVRAIGDDGNPAGKNVIVKISINGVTYKFKTNDKGYASIPINLIPKKYTITSSYHNYEVKNKVTVKQILKLVKKTVTVKKGKKITLKAKLKKSNGKAMRGKLIKFKFRGKTYKAKTNKKGIAKVTIKNKKVLKKLKKGKKYTFAATYIKDIIKGKVKIKK